MPHSGPCWAELVAATFQGGGDVGLSSLVSNLENRSLSKIQISKLLKRQVCTSFNIPSNLVRLTWEHPRGAAWCAVDVTLLELESVGGESNIGPKAGDMVETKQGEPLTWNLYRSQENIINLLKAIGNYESVTAYAFCYVESERDLKAELFSLGSDDRTAVWFNGKLVDQNSAGRRLVVDQDSLPMEVKRGNNRLLIKITQREGEWGFVGRFRLGVSGRLFVLDGVTPHNSVVVQALRGNQVVDTVLSNQNGYYQLALPATG